MQTLTEKLMTYALGRSVEYYDMPTVRQIVRDAARDNYRFSSLVMGDREERAVPDAQSARGRSGFDDGAVVQTGRALAVDS